MQAIEGIARLEPVLVKDTAGRYCFPCPKARVVLRFQDGSRRPVEFGARDKVGFRADESGLLIEELKTGSVRKRFTWRDLESVAAGEPETDGGYLFQG